LIKKIPIPKAGHRKTSLVFSHKNTAPFYGLAYPNGVAKTIVYAQNTCALLYTYPHFMATFTSMCHVISTHMYSISHPIQTVEGEKKRLMQ